MAAVAAPAVEAAITAAQAAGVADEAPALESPQLAKRAYRPTASRADLLATVEGPKEAPAGI